MNRDGDRVAPLAAACLVAAVLPGWQAARQLSASIRPPPSWPYALAFAIALGLAWAAGRAAAGREPRRERDRSEPPWEPCSKLRRVALGVSLVSILATWHLQSHPNPPRAVLATWAIALVSTPLAFPKRASGGRSPSRKWPLWAVALAVVAFAVAAWARLAKLAEMPRVFSGDEVNQVVDGREWLRGSSHTDPFGTGWIGTIRLGMIPAGAAGLHSSSPIAAPRLPYAVAGTLSVAAAGLAAAAAGGPVAAVGCVSFLALAPHHLHFSRLASVQILDSLFAALAVGLLFQLRRSGSPRAGVLAGVAAGLSLYGYAGGRVVPIVLLAATLWIALSRRLLGGRRWWVAFALVAGFAVAGGPNLRFAVRHFPEWNSRFNQVSVFQKGWLEREIQTVGSLRKVAERQLKAGTLGLFYSTDSTPWYTGYPILGPAILVGFGVAGLGWLAGRRRTFEASILALLIAGNFAGVVLTTTVPAPQRISSLLPALSVLGGVTFAALLSFLPAGERGGMRWRAAGALLGSGAILAASIRGYPLDWGPHAAYGGRHAALAQAASSLLTSERFRGKPVYLHGWRYVDSSFPSFCYFLPGVRLIDDDPSMTGYTAASLRPGVHLFSGEWIATAEGLRRELGLEHAIRLSHPAFPDRDAGYVLVVPGELPVPRRVGGA